MLSLANRGRGGRPAPRELAALPARYVPKRANFEVRYNMLWRCHRGRRHRGTCEMA